MASLGRPNADYAGDRGDADPDVRAKLAAAGDREGYLRAVAALCTARFLLPVVALGDASGEGPQPDRHAELRAVQLQAADGSVALPAFTGLDALLAWRPDARPVPCRLDELAESAFAEGAVALLVDVAGPNPLVIEGDLLAELARRHRLVELPQGGWGWMYGAPDADSSPQAPTG